MSKRKPHSKRKSPHSIAVTEDKLLRAKGEAVEEAVNKCFLLVATCLLDKHGWSLDEVTDLWKQVEYTDSSVTSKYTSWPELRLTIEKEQGCKLMDV